MFERVTVTTPDLPAAERGYAALIGAPPPWPDFELREVAEGSLATEGLHVAFRAPSRELVARRWQAAVDAGFPDDGPPGPRPRFRDDYFGGFARDPGGNSAEAVHYEAPHPPGRIDHLWLRVADLPAARARFAGAVEAAAGWRMKVEEPQLIRFASPEGSLTFLPGERPTANVEIALPGGAHIRL